jgi:hypothetical protein
VLYAQYPVKMMVKSNVNGEFLAGLVMANGAFNLFSNILRIIQ